ncbi:hypothetical protein PU560_11585, partial [Georgenia sp. 10Sc9-8]|nr:hypothetical protein [Georgenia halotolerans]
ADELDPEGRGGSGAGRTDARGTGAHRDDAEYHDDDATVTDPDRTGRHSATGDEDPHGGSRRA